MNKKHGIFPEPGTVQFERLLPGPSKRIWDYLTKSELKAKWLSEGDVESRVGGKVEFKFNHSELCDVDDSIPNKYKMMEGGTYFEGTVLEWNPYTKLSYTWAEGTEEASIVTYELFPKQNNTVLLKLTHRRLGDDTFTLISVSAGWHTHLGILGDRLAGKQPESFWSMHTKMENIYKEVIIDK